MKKNYILLTALMLFNFAFVFGQPTQPGNPPPGNTSNCTITGTGGVALDQCPVGSTTFVTNFQGGAYNRGNSGNHLGDGAIWRFTNIGTISGVTINAEVTVNSHLNATLTNMDDNTATDQAGNSVADFFAPVIAPDVALNLSDRRGYVQFTINFFQGTNDFTTAITINNLNLISYDADGNYNTGGTSSQTWFRETRVAQSYSGGNPTILASGSTELSAYSYTDPVATTWNGFAGGVYERTGISRCAEVASSFRYGNGANGRPSITVRFGYDFKAGSGYNVGNPGRQYGAKFGCYSFPSQSTLPLKLLSFNGAYHNQHTVLNWSTENEQNFDHFEVERSTNGFDFASIGSQNARGSVDKTDYLLNDDLSSVSGNIFYYRLKIIDKDGRYMYSQVVLIQKDSKAIAGISINPNPVSGGIATVRITAASQSAIELRVIDISGRILLQQTQKIFEGNNAITIDVQRLQSGIYSMQVVDGNTIMTTKFSVIR